MRDDEHSQPKQPQIHFILTDIHDICIDSGVYYVPIDVCTTRCCLFIHPIFLFCELFEYNDKFYVYCQLISKKKRNKKKITVKNYEMWQLNIEIASDNNKNSCWRNQQWRWPNIYLLIMPCAMICLTVAIQTIQ